MHKNKIVQYLHRVIAAFCTWYLYRYDIVPMLPGYSLKKAFHRVGAGGVVTAEDRYRKGADMERSARLYIPDSPHFQDKAFTDWLVREHVKAVAHPEEVETVYIVFGDTVAK